MSERKQRHPALLLLVATVISFAAGFGARRLWAARLPDLGAYEAAIREAAGRAGLEVALLQGLVAAESGGRVDAVSHAGATGLCQLRLSTAQDLVGRRRVLTADELRAPDLNLDLGARYLALQLARFDGDVALALAAYNAGPTHAKRWSRRSAHVPGLEVVRREGFAETRTYVSRVLGYRTRYRQ
jgi:soluble lytic murein transglycosylase